jgi:hypothetical protein
MKTASRLLLGVLAAASLAGVAAAASAAPVTGAFGPDHPRQAQVLTRAANERIRIREERREGVLSRGQAHRLLVADKRIVRQEHRMARANGGRITRGEQQRLNREEGAVGRHIPR